MSCYLIYLFNYITFFIKERIKKNLNQNMATFFFINVGVRVSLHAP